MHPWKCADHAWDRVHVDYSGPFMGQMFLVVIDAYSKRIEIEMVKLATARNTIEYFCMMFARFGLPKVLVTDNRTFFTSSDFTEFTSRIESSICVLLPITPLQMVRLKGLCRPLSYSCRNKETVSWYTTVYSSCSTIG